MPLLDFERVLVWEVYLFAFKHDFDGSKQFTLFAKDRLESCVVLSGDEWNRLSDHNPVLAQFRSVLFSESEKTR